MSEQEIPAGRRNNRFKVGVAVLSCTALMAAGTGGISSVANGATASQTTVVVPGTVGGSQKDLVLHVLKHESPHNLKHLLDGIDSQVTCNAPCTVRSRIKISSDDAFAAGLHSTIIGAMTVKSRKDLIVTYTTPIRRRAAQALPTLPNGFTYAIQYFAHAR